MDFPILRYVDILIGLAAVMLLACTIVAAVTQLVLSSTYARARYLRDALQDLVTQLDPGVLGSRSRYIAERMLRHPLAARDNTIFGRLTGWLRDKWRSQARRGLPLPHLNPPDVIQREEIILFLLEWAAEDGALAHQDAQLAQADETCKRQLDRLRDSIRRALIKTGVADPAATAKGIRLRMMLNESAHPEQPANVWRAQAVAEAAPSDLAAMVHAWYDNTMARVTENFALEAKVAASILALLVCFTVQLDSVNLLRRLAHDDKFRAALVVEADAQVKRYEDAQAKLANAEGDEKTRQQHVADEATFERERISATLATMRDPALSVVPSYLAFQKVATAEVCAPKLDLENENENRVFRGTLSAGADRAALRFKVEYPSRFIPNLAAAVRASGVLVAVREEKNGCAKLVAQQTDAEEIQFVQASKSITAPLHTNLGRRIDWTGLGEKMPGIVLSWILVSLGAPFWYDLLKKLLGFRSVLARKDDDERTSRQVQQAVVPASAVAPPAAAAIDTGIVVGGDDERGDLGATGAAG